MVAARRAKHKVQDFSCLDQSLVRAFAQLTARESLRDIEINLRAQRKHFYHMGLRCKTVSRNTLASARFETVTLRNSPCTGSEHV